LPAKVPPGLQVLYTAGKVSAPLPGALAMRRLGQAWPLAAWHAADPSQAVAMHTLKGRPLLAAAGLAAPEKFFSMLRDVGLDFTPMPLPDHHAYARLPWPQDATDVILTEKDAIKLQPGRMGSTRVWVVPLDLDIPPALVTELMALLPPRAAPMPPLPPVPQAPTVPPTS
jgi:tetraacyldisaccharide 4'-kinase